MNKELEKNMNKIFKISSLAALGALFLTNTVLAQQVNNGQVKQMQMPQSLITIPTNQKVPMNNVSNDSSNSGLNSSSNNSVGQGNVFEQQTTPLLRELARKKSILELDKLNLEIAKVEKDTLKEKNESVNGMQNPTNVNMANPSPTVPFYGMNKYSPNPTSNMQQPIGLPNDLGSGSNDIKVYMTYGKINNLYAKIGYGSEGGYSVKAGDILPDGRKVILVKPDYIEISKNVYTSKKEKGIEKIFVTAPVVKTQTNQNSINPAGGTASSTSLGPLKMPVYNNINNNGAAAQPIPFVGFNSPQ
jgi:hypothetical protein